MVCGSTPGWQCLFAVQSSCPYRRKIVWSLVSRRTDIQARADLRHVKMVTCLDAGHLRVVNRYLSRLLHHPIAQNRRTGWMETVIRSGVRCRYSARVRNHVRFCRSLSLGEEVHVKPSVSEQLRSVMRNVPQVSFRLDGTIS
jgi:hypothetical protein